MTVNYDYLIVGGGMTAAAAVAGIREIDRRGTIGLIAAEPHAPYDRPPLTKALWKGDPLDSIWRKIDGQGVTSHTGRTARNLDPSSRRVVDDLGRSYTYGKLLLATGSTPRRFAFGEAQIIYFRTVDDWQRLRAMASHGKRIAIVGAGFIASELAASLANNNQQVVMIFPHEGIGSRMYPPEMAVFLNDVYRERGVEILSGSMVTGCDSRDEKVILTVRSNGAGADREVLVDGVVAGIGVQPNVELARAAGLTVEDGIRVDASLRTSDPNIFAAGDVASFYDRSLNEWRRVEHADNATTMGGDVGIAMAGRTVVYDHIPFFYSDFFDFGYEAVGHVDSRLEMVADWTVPYREGVIYYLHDQSVRGVLLWNIWGQADAARRLLGAPGSPAMSGLIGQLGKTHSRFGGSMSATPRRRRPIARKQAENAEPLWRPTGVGSEAAEGIHGVGTTADSDANTPLEGRSTGTGFRDGAKRTGSEPLPSETSVQHKSGYGGEGAAPRTSADERECLDAEGNLKSED